MMLDDVALAVGWGLWLGLPKKKVEKNLVGSEEDWG